MKKGAMARLIIFSLTALLLTAVLVLGIVFNNVTLDMFAGSDFSIGIAGNTYANADSYTVGGGSITEKITSAEINWVSGSVDVSFYNGETVEISETPVDDNDYKLRYKTDGEKLIIQYESSRWYIGFVKRPKKKLTVKIPKAYADSFKKLNIGAVSADINLRDISAAEKLEIDNVNGAVKAENIKTALLKFDTVSGDVTASGEISKIDSSTVSGDVTITTSTELKALSTDSTSGDVTVTIPENSGFTLEFDKVSGDFNSDFSTVKKDGKYICGSGSAKFNADTVSGDFTVKKLKRD